MFEHKWAKWGDGFMCVLPLAEIYTALGFRPRDYEIIHVLEYHPDGKPKSWLKKS